MSGVTAEEPDERDPTESAAQGSGENEPSAENGVEHLQSAAHEMVAAARSFLDAIEEVISDERSLTKAVDTMSGLMGVAGEALGHIGDRISSGDSGSDEKHGPPGTSRIKKVNLD